MILRPYGEDDLALTRSMELDPLVMRHLGGAADEDRALSVHRQRLAGQAAGDWYFTVLPEEGAEPVGIVAIWRSDFEGEQIYELGLMFRAGSHRQGHGLAASRQVIADFAAAGLAPQLHGFTSIDNVASEQGAHVLGFRLVGESDLDYEGRPLRCYHWVLDV
jgi:RimJ/RimL family protein N-acetyltransferase